MPTISYKIEDLILDSYEFEIFITDIWCLYLSDLYNLEYERIFVTSPNNDGGIDSIVIFRDLYGYKDKQYYFLQISRAKKQAKYLFANFKDNVEQHYKNIIGTEWDIHKKVCMTIENEPSNTSSIGIDIDFICGNKLRELIDLVARRYELIDENNNLNKRYKKNIEIRKKVCERMNKYNSKDSRLDIFELYNDYLLYNFKAIKDKKFGTIELVETLIDSRIDAISGILDQNFSAEKLQLLGDIYINNNEMKSRKKDMTELVNFVVGIKDYIKLNKSIDLEVYATRYYLGLKQNRNVVAHFSYNLNNSFAFSCIYNNLDTSYGHNSRIVNLENIGNKNNHNYRKDTFLTDPKLDTDEDIIKYLVEQSLS